MDRLQDHTESPVDPSGSQQPNKTLMRFKGGGGGGAVHFQPALFIPLLNIVYCCSVSIFNIYVSYQSSLQ